MKGQVTLLCSYSCDTTEGHSIQLNTQLVIGKGLSVKKSGSIKSDDYLQSLKETILNGPYLHLVIVVIEFENLL